MKWFLIFNSFLVMAATEKPLSWPQAIELLKQNNANYKGAEATFQSVQSLEKGAASGYWPALSGSLDYNKVEIADGDSSSLYSASLTLNQNLFSGLKDRYSVQQAQAKTRAAQNVFEKTKAQISYDFVGAYQGVLTAQESIKLTENIIARRQNNLRLVQLRFEGGRENKGSVLLSEAYLAQAKYEKLIAQNNLNLAQTTLQDSLGISSETVVKIHDEVPSSYPSTTPRFEELATTTPEYQEFQAQVDADVAAIGVARSSFFPSLNLVASVGRNSPDFFPQKERWSVGASLSIPLFNGGKDSALLKSASLVSASSSARKSSVNYGQVELLKQTYQKLIESTEKLKVDESFQKASSIRAEVARGQYNNGLITFTEWDNIENDLIVRQKAYLQSKKEKVLNEAAWKQAVGEGVLP